MPQPSTFGRADLPVPVGDGGDHLNMGKYAGALARFIQACETPMTVGLQGEWGSGKTSLMNMIRHKLPAKDATDKFHVFDFQTWQYGALNQDDMLGILLMKAILQAFVERCHKNDRVKWLSSKIVTLIGSVAKGSVSAVARKAGLDGENFVKSLVEATDPASDLKEIRAEFGAIVKEMTGGEEDDAPGRIIILIDDLDRVRPERAVAMLEVIKNFMDVERCVFVIACDYDVVQRGVELRLGIKEADKADAFFHKLIQVPFSMPSASYSVRTMLQDYLCSRTSENHAEKISARISDIIQEATGTNPRAFKRFLNRVDLHSCIQEGGVWGSPESAVGLIGLVALQLEWPEIATHLAGHRELDTFKVEFEGLCNLDLVAEQLEDKSEIGELLYNQYGKDWKEKPKVGALRRYMEGFQQALERDGNEGLSETELTEVHKHAKNLGLTLAQRQSEQSMFYDAWESQDR